ncbi:MAG: type II secretion system protein GspM [Rhodocyclaceae bacterium]|nr:type II secretion system protein GspM [Rhodocyclaceae bacterium]
MKARWQALEAKFAALQKREKGVVAVAALLGILMIGYDLWIDPASSRAANIQKQITRDKADMQSLQAQLAGLMAQLKDPDASSKAALADLKHQIAVVDQELHEYDRILLPPERVQELLRSLLARHRGLELVSLQTLPPVPLLALPEVKSTDGKTAPAVPAKGAGIHKHGIEIKISGNYLDLLAYVSDLERLPQRLFWGNMSLAVATYPKSELTLTVYTLSSDSIWLVV